MLTCGSGKASRRRGSRVSSILPPTQEVENKKRESLIILHTVYVGYLGDNLVGIFTVYLWVHHISRFYKQYNNILTLDPIFVLEIMLHFHTLCIILLNLCNSSELVYNHYKYLDFGGDI